MHVKGKLLKRVLIICSAFTLTMIAACGGNSDPNTLGTTAVTPAASTVSISGTAATGAPISGGAVSARCQGGISATTVTQSNGNFSMSVVSAALPCAIQLVPMGGGQALYSLASGTGTAVTINITPLTTLALALAVQNSTAQTLDAWFALTPSLQAVANALIGTQTILGTALAVAGYNVPSPFAPISASFAAVPGNAYDDLLETVAAGLRASGQTFAVAQTLFTTSGGTSMPTPAPVPPAPSGGLGATVSASLNASLVGNRNLAFYADSGTGCGTLCSFTEGAAVAVVLGNGNTLTLAGKTLSNPYHRILQGATQPHTPEIIWRDGNLEYALTNNDSGTFNEINVGDTSAPNRGLPRFMGQIRAMQRTGLSNITQFAGTYAKAFQYSGPLTGIKAPTWTSMTIGTDGAITFAGGNGPSLSTPQLGMVTDFISSSGSVLVNALVNTTIGDTVVDSFDSIRLFRNAAGQLSAVEYAVDNRNNYVGMLLGTLAPLATHNGSAIPTRNLVAGTANGTNYSIVATGGGYSFANQGGINQIASTGSGNTLQQWAISADRQGPLSVGTTFACQLPNTGNNNDVTLNFTAGSNFYRSSAGGRCLITVTSVAIDGSGVTSYAGIFTAELYTFKRDLPPLIINDGVFRWVKP